jgi:hypothetical protein
MGTRPVRRGDDTGDVGDGASRVFRRYSRAAGTTPGIRLEVKQVCLLAATDRVARPAGSDDRRRLSRRRFYDAARGGASCTDSLSSLSKPGRELVVN